MSKVTLGFVRGLVLTKPHGQSSDKQFQLCAVDLEGGRNFGSWGSYSTPNRQKATVWVLGVTGRRLFSRSTVASRLYPDA